MLTATIDMTAFNAGMRGLVQKCKLSAPLVVKKEVGSLIKELIKRSPPSNRKRSMLALSDRIHGRFFTMSKIKDSSNTPLTSGDIVWGRHSKSYLRAFKKHEWKPNPSHSELKRLFYSTTKKGYQLLPFKHPRKIQKVLLRQGITVGQPALNKFVKTMQKNFGRLKAGWLVATTFGRSGGSIPLSGDNMPPKWVTVHAAGAKGRFQDGLQNRDNPTFLIANSAKGITQKGVDFVVQLAVKSRAASMVTNARLMFSGKKNVADYA